MKNKIEFIRKGTIIILSKLVLNSNSCVRREEISELIRTVGTVLYAHPHPPAHTHNCHLHVHQDKQ